MKVVKEEPVNDAAALTEDQITELNKIGEETLETVKGLNIKTLDTVITIMFRYAAASLPQGELFIFEEMCKKIAFTMRGEPTKKLVSMAELDKLQQYIVQNFPKTIQEGDTPVDVAIRVMDTAYADMMPKKQPGKEQKTPGDH